MWFGVAALLVAVSCISIAQFLNSIVPDPYMDEIFHVRQTQTYCAGNFTVWDNKITTLPGLYVAVLPAVHVMSLATGTPVSDVCTTSTLRLLNVGLFGLSTPLVLWAVLSALHPNQKGARTFIKCLEIMLFPVSFFVMFLFYTDTLSTMSVLLCYYFGLKRRNALAAVVGAFAIFARQTNVCWVFFVFASQVVIEYENQTLFPGQQSTTPVTSFSQVPRAMVSLVRSGLLNLPFLMLRFWPFLCVLGGFVIFVLLNRGIVVGDRSNHMAIFHFPQYLYWSVVAAVTQGLTTFGPSRVRQLRDVIFKRKRGVAGWVVGCAWLLCVAAALALLVHRYTFAHPFLLADNRHYTFYLWAKTFRRHSWFKFMLIPVYMFSFWTLRRVFDGSRSLLWQVLFFICTACVLVPSPLIELRYYIVPITLAQLHEHTAATWHLVVHCVALLLANAVLLWVFLYRPFVWPDSSTARFMW